MIKKGRVFNRKEIFSYFLFVSLFILLFNLNFICADIKMSNYSVEKNYAYSDNLRGWINISLTNVASDSVFSFNNKNINVLNLIKMSVGASGYNCSSVNCEADYSASDSLSPEKDFSLDYGASSIFGFKIQTSNLDGIDSMNFLVDSNAVESCISPLSVDILDDGIIDWVSDSSSSSFCPRLNGCYDFSIIQKTAIADGSEYCETFSDVNPFPKISLGAKVYGSSAASFKLNIFNEDRSFDKSCTVQLEQGSSSVDREISCSINQSNALKSDMTVCLSKLSGSGYFIYYEDSSPVCGFIDVYPHDFAIYLDSAKYGLVNNVVFNSTKLPNLDISTYIEGKYANDCSKGCFIPVRIYSGTNDQEIVIKSANLQYRADGLQNDVSNFYLLDKTASEINMGYSKINLAGSGLLVPASSGNYKLPFYFRDQELAKFNISILSLPVIGNVFPAEVPAGVPVVLNAQVSNNLNGSTYVWDFGDNSSAVSSPVAKIEHTYNFLGTYSLTLNVSNELGVSNKVFSINVISPKSIINNTLFDETNKLTSLKSQLNSFPPLVKSFVLERLNVSNLETSLQDARVRYNVAQDDVDEYISIISTLYALKIPDSINITSQDSGAFVPFLSNVNLQTFVTLVGEGLVGREENTKKAIFDWYLNNLKVTADLKTYSAVYDGSIEILGTFVSFNIIPTTEQNQIYMVINEPSEKIYGLSDLKVDSESSAIVFDITSMVKQEFIVFDKFRLIDLPVYFSPSLSKLETNLSLSACNYNNVCEKDAGEDSSNCLSDCKPFVKSGFFIILVLIGVLVLYIIAQEWYKKRYEDYLFNDKNELYNLINFIANAEKQGFKREEIIKKLREKKWDSEKLVYAYKKYKGERTGMIEIPIFRYFEQRKVNLELEKRKNQGARPIDKNFTNFK